MPPVLVAEISQTVGAVSVVAVLVTAFGYAIALLSKGTERIDKSAEGRVAEAEEERDRARREKAEELAQVRAECERRHAEDQREIDYWRALALDRGGRQP